MLAHVLALALALGRVEAPSLPDEDGRVTVPAEATTRISGGLNAVLVFPVIQLGLDHRFRGGLRLCAAGGSNGWIHLAELGLEVPLAELSPGLFLDGRAAGRFRGATNDASGHLYYGVLGDVGLALRYARPGLELGYGIDGGPWFGEVDSTCREGLCPQAYFVTGVRSWWIRPQLWASFGLGPRWALEVRAGVAWYERPLLDLEFIGLRHWVPELELGAAYRF